MSVRLKYATFAVITILLPLLLLEGGVRLFFSGWIDRHLDYAARLDDTMDDLIVRKTVNGRPVYYSPFLPTKYFRDLPDTGGNMVSVEKGSRSYRVLVFGGSTVAGSPFGHWASFSRFLEDGLKSVLHPDARVEVMNFGMSSASTRTVRLLLERLPDLEPDLIIIYSGANEVCDSSNIDPVSAGTLEYYATVAGNWLFDHVYLYRGSAIVAEYAETVLSDGWSIYAVYPCPSRYRQFKDRSEFEQLDALYRSNLERIIRLSEDKGADVLLLSQVANLVVPPAVPAAADAEEAAAIEALGAAFADDDKDAYQAARRRLAAADPSSPQLSYFDGLAALRAGDRHRAQALLQRAVDTDPEPTRYRSDYTEVLRELAAGDPAVHFIDVPTHLDGLVDDGIPDGRVVMDEMHPTIELNKYIASLIIEDYMAQNDVRPDIFDFHRFDRASVFGPFAEEKFYRVACRRYYDTDDWNICVKSALGELEENKAQNRYGLYRADLRAWELLFYFGRTQGRSDAVVTAAGLYRAPSIAAAMKGRDDE
jgi:lysophospholipase L1-like esterase